MLVIRCVESHVTICCFLPEPAHEKSHAQTTSVRKATNDKAREDCALARDYQKRKAERRKSWLKSVIKLHSENPINKTTEENQLLVESSQEGNLSPLNPQQLHFGFTSGNFQLQANQNPSTPSLPILVVPQTPPPPPLPPQTPQIVMANLPVQPRINNLIHIPYFLEDRDQILTHM